MNRVIWIVLAAVVFSVSCVKKNTPEVVLNNTVDTTMAMKKSMGDFMNGPHGMVTGKATIYSQGGNLVLALRDMNISNGPDLHVYISKEVQPENFIDLGSLQSTLGNQVYTIPGSPDLSQYQYALVHCKKYNHLFGSAKLQ